VGEKLHKKVNL